MSYLINGLSIVFFFHSHEILFVTENQKLKTILKTCFMARICIKNLKITYDGQRMRFSEI